MMVRCCKMIHSLQYISANSSCTSVRTALSSRGGGEEKDQQGKDKGVVALLSSTRYSLALAVLSTVQVSLSIL